MLNQTIWIPQVENEAHTKCCTSRYKTEMILYMLLKLKIMARKCKYSRELTINSISQK
jgi:hypothetical protein